MLKLEVIGIIPAKGIVAFSVDITLLDHCTILHRLYGVCQPAVNCDSGICFGPDEDVVVYCVIHAHRCNCLAYKAEGGYGIISVVLGEILLTVNSGSNDDDHLNDVCLC